MHNVICAGTRTQEENLQIIKKAGIPMKIVHGDKDQVVPVECSYNMKSRVPYAEIQIMNGEDHNSIIIGREKEFTRELEGFWFSASRNNSWTMEQWAD
jgi:pimeloyl-ACP methyl ester carboxylesterase